MMVDVSNMYNTGGTRPPPTSETANNLRMRLPVGLILHFALGSRLPVRWDAGAQCA